MGKFDSNYDALRIMVIYYAAYDYVLGTTRDKALARHFFNSDEFQLYTKGKIDKDWLMNNLDKLDRHNPTFTKDRLIFGIIGSGYR